ncbi:flagellar filament capping protein FliD [Polymorphobacter sp.]|uniref:flagellar filament capping protein FliD n=1 Tax=Polymorphobacter sp. TaxID=1909290 RepID=UPI003F70A2EE
MTEILSQLGVGTGINSRSVIDELVAAQRTAQTEPLNTRLETIGSRVDALGQLKSAFDAIATSLQDRVRAGVFGLQPRSADTAAISIERIGAGPSAGFRSDLAVQQLAAGQRLVAAPLSSVDAPVGLGTLNILFGTRTETGGGAFDFAVGSGMDDFSVTITAANNSLAGLRDAINAGSDGTMAASIINTGSGATLVMRGPDGAERAFVVSAAEDVDNPGLSRFAYTAGNRQQTLSATAADAAMLFDGVTVTRSSNVIDDLLPGVRLRLEQETGSRAVSLSASRDVAALSETLSDYAETLGAMRQLIGDFRRGGVDGEAAGPLAGNATARLMDQALVALISAPITAAGGMRLRDLGVQVTRDGLVTFDSARLASLSEADLGRAEALIGSQAGSGFGTGLASLRGISDLVAPATEGLDRQRQAVNRQLEQAEARLTTYKETLTRQFAAMDQLVAGSKSVGVQLDQLIQSWYRRDE